MVNNNVITRDEILDMSVGSLVSNISRAYLVFINQEIEKYGIHGGQFHLLAGLSKKDSISQEELAKTYHINQSTMARALRKLEDSGMISRRADETNRRKNIITVTPNGRRTVDNIRSMDEKWENNIKSLADDDKDKFKQFLKTMALEVLLD